MGQYASQISNVLFLHTYSIPQIPCASYQFSVYSFKDLSPNAFHESFAGGRRLLPSRIEKCILQVAYNFKTYLVGNS